MATKSSYPLCTMESINAKQAIDKLLQSITPQIAVTATGGVLPNIPVPTLSLKAEDEWSTP